MNRAELSRRLGVTRAQVSELIKGHGFLSRTQRKIIENLSRGVLDEDVLTGKKKPPEIKAPAPEPEPPPSVLQDDGKDGETIAKEQTFNNIALLVRLRDDPRSSPNLRMKCAKELIEIGEGKPRQRREAEKEGAPVTEDELMRKLNALLQDAKEKAGLT